MGRLPVPLVTFRAYPERQTLFFFVYIWKTAKDLRQIAKTRKVRPVRHTTAFATVYHRIAGKGDMSRVCGEIHFCKRYLFTEVISHECTHAAIGWARRMRLLEELVAETKGTMVGDAEERVCYVVGKLSQQCVNRIAKAGLFE